jgi:hypothetical protein
VDEGRFTLQGAVRYDRASSWAPAEHNGTTEISRFNPAPITFPRTVTCRRLQRHHHAMGHGLGRLRQRQDGAQGQRRQYLQNATNDENYTANNPAARIQRNVLTPAAGSTTAIHRRLRSAQSAPAGQPRDGGDHAPR